MYAKSLQSSQILCDPVDYIMAPLQQAPLFMKFSRQEYWSGLSFPTSGDLPNTGIKPCLLCLLHWQVGSLPI